MSFRKKVFRLSAYLNEALTQPAVIRSMSVMERVEKYVKSV